MNTVKAETIKIELTRRYKASAEQVFDAWLDPEGVGSWFFCSPDGEMKRVELDPRVDGKFVISEQRGDTLAEHFGTYLQIDRPKLLVFAYNMDVKESLTVVTIQITALEDGCELTLSHDLDPKWAEFVEQAYQGWNMILDGLGLVVDI